MKKLSSKRAKALAITKKTKDKVYERDNGLCIICSSNQGLPEAHYIRRSRGGLGIEQNIVTLCRACHSIFDSGTKEERKVLGQMIRMYLESRYENWNEEMLYYDKYASYSPRNS